MTRNPARGTLALPFVTSSFWELFEELETWDANLSATPRQCASPPKITPCWKGRRRVATMVVRLGREPRHRLMDYVREEIMPHHFCVGCGCGTILNVFTNAVANIGLEIIPRFPEGYPAVRSLFDCGVDDRERSDLLYSSGHVPVDPELSPEYESRAHHAGCAPQNLLLVHLLEHELVGGDLETPELLQEVLFP